ncbi:MAG: hypothetical protein JW720_02240 [Sedimentisphaerales bacterium]|nr:hypothetical protein [Sedimentisphaerales bacterium]
MDNANFSNPAVPNYNRPIPPVDDEPIRIDDLDKPIPAAKPPAGRPSVSHAPLNLGGPPAAPAPNAAKIDIPKPVAAKPPTRITSGERITGVKTFFTKLHPGALPFLDEQITAWLKENPGISIKHTNITTGEVQSKKTEPNLIITVWY